MTHLTAELVYWITEREAIRYRRAAGEPRPWSEDPIFRTVRFCNTHRERDTVTQWIRQWWNTADDPAWRFVLARLLNLPESLAEVQQFRQPDNIRTILKMRRTQGHKVFTSAYTVSTCGQAIDKVDYIINVINAVREEERLNPIRYGSCHSTWQHLQLIDGLGSFLAAQVVADMKNTRRHPLAGAPDWWTFSAPGPGSLRGLSWYFKGRPDGVTPTNYAAALAECRAQVDHHLHHIDRLSDQDFQNCLCEFSKYMKVKTYGGHVRNKFNGG